MFKNEKKHKVEEEAQPEGENASAGKAEKPVEIKEDELKKLTAEAAEYKDKYLRLYAEFENVRKRTEREKQEFVKYANEGLLGDFLGILDDLERSVEAAKANHQDYAAFLKGIEMVMAHVYELLKRNDVKPIESVGKKFDPYCHEVLMQEESDQHEEGTVVEEFQKGYYLAGRVIRTAKVKVARKKDQEKQPEH